MPFSKVAYAAATEKVAAAELTEIPDAIRVGFAQACADIGLTPEHGDRLGKFASIVLAVSAPTKGYAKVAADFSPADTVPTDPGEIAFRKQLEAQQAKRAPVAPAPAAPAPVAPGSGAPLPAYGVGGAPTANDPGGLFAGMTGADLKGPPAPAPKAPVPAMTPPPKPVVTPKPVVPPSPAPPIVPGGKP